MGSLAQAENLQMRTMHHNIRKIRILNSFFLQRLYHDNENTYVYEKVKRWTRHYDVFNEDILITIHNQNNVHWAIVVVDFNKRFIVYLDQMNKSQNHDFIVDVMFKWLEDEAKEHNDYRPSFT